MKILDNIKARIKQRINTRNTIEMLHSLTDAELRDIGISRGMIDEVARGVLDVHRMVRDND